MTKLNGFESHAIITGLEMYKNTLKQEIANAEAAGKRPFMTQGFVDMFYCSLYLFSKKVVYEPELNTLFKSQNILIS